MGWFRKLVVSLMAVVLFIITVLPGGSVHAGDGEDTEESDLRSYGEVIEEIRDLFEYDEELHRELVRAILDGEGFRTPDYASVMSRGSTAVGIYEDEGAVESINAVMPLYARTASVGSWLRTDVEVQYFDVGTMQVYTFMSNSSATSNVFSDSNRLSSEAGIGIGKGLLGNIDAKEFYDRSTGSSSFPQHAAAVSALLENNELGQGASTNVSKVMSLDLYGNIVTEDGDVVIPFWQNKMVEEFDWMDGKSFLTTPAVTAEVLREGRGFFDNFLDGADRLTNGILRDTTIDIPHSMRRYMEEISERDADDMDELYHEFSNGGTEFNHLESFGRETDFTPGEGNLSGMSGGYREMSDEQKDMFVDLVVEVTREGVRNYNSNVLDELVSADEGEFEIYTELNVLGEPYTAEDMRAELDEMEGFRAYFGKIMDEGPFFVLKMMVSGWFSDFYHHNFINFGAGDVFNTQLVSETPLWDSIFGVMLVLAVAFATLYTLMMLVRIFMGFLTVTGMITRLLLFILAMAAPVLLYSPLVDYAFNKTSQYVLEDELNKMFMFDAWAYHQGSGAEESDNPFISEANVRERFEEYTVPVYTNRSVDGYDLNDPDDMQYRSGLPREDDVVVVNVSIFHIFEWLHEGEDVELFDYLERGVTGGSSLYSGIGRYDEYIYDPSSNLFGEDRVPFTFSELARDVFDELDSLEYETSLSEITRVGDEVFNTQMDSREEYSFREIDRVLDELVMTPDAREVLFGGPGEASGSTEQVLEIANVELREDTDIFGTENVVRGMLDVRVGGTSQINSEVLDINRAVVDRFYGNLYELRQLGNVRSGSYQEAERDVLMMYMLFEIASYYDLPFFARDLDTASVTMDTYVRSLFVPYNEYAPGNHALEDVAFYISQRVGMFTLLMFGLMLVTVLAYGIVKTMVLLWMLLPLTIILGVWNFVVLENTRSKLWVGVLGIVGSFALVNTGLVLLWSFLTNRLNGDVMNVAQNVSVTGITYNHVLWNSLAIIIYLLVMLKFVGQRLFRAVKGDLRNLGGETMSQGALDLSGKIKDGASKLFNGIGKASPKSMLGKIGSEGIHKKQQEKWRSNKDKQTQKEEKKREAKARKMDDLLKKNDKDLTATERVKKRIELNKRKAKAGIEKLKPSAMKKSLVGSYGKVAEGAYKKFKDSGDFDSQEFKDMTKSIQDQYGYDKQTAEEKAKGVLRRQSKYDDIAGKEGLSEAQIAALEKDNKDEEVVDQLEGSAEGSVVLDIKDRNARALAKEELSRKGKVVERDGKLILDKTEDEFGGEAGKKAYMDDVIGRVGKQASDLAEKELNVEKKGVGTTLKQGEDGMFRVADDKNKEFVMAEMDKMEKEEGSGIVKTYGKNGEVLYEFESGDVQNDVLEEIYEKTDKINRDAGDGGVMYETNEVTVSRMEKQLKAQGVSYRVSGSGDNKRISVAGGDEDKAGSIVKQMEDEGKIASGDYLEIGGSDYVVNDNVAVKDYVQEAVGQGILDESDVEIVGNNVVAKTVKSKKYLSGLGDEEYQNLKQSVVRNLRDEQEQLMDYVSGDDQNVAVSLGDAFSEGDVADIVAENDLDKQVYRFSNRRFSLNDVKSVVKQYEKDMKRVEKLETEIAPKYDNLDQDVRVHSEQVKKLGAEIKNIEDPEERRQKMIEKSQVESRLNKKKSELKAVEKEFADTSVLQETMAKDYQTKVLVDYYKDLEKMGIEEKRVGDNQLEIKLRGKGKGKQLSQLMEMRRHLIKDKKVGNGEDKGSK